MATPANNAAVLSNSFFLMECFLFFLFTGLSLYGFPVRGPLLSLEKKTSLDRLQFRSPTGNAAASRRSVPTDSREPNVQAELGNYCGLLWRIKIGRGAASALNWVRSAR